MPRAKLNPSLFACGRETDSRPLTLPLRLLRLTKTFYFLCIRISFPQDKGEFCGSTPSAVAQSCHVDYDQIEEIEVKQKEKKNGWSPVHTSSVAPTVRKYGLALEEK
jgi:hypothetical protein